MSETSFPQMKVFFGSPLHYKRYWLYANRKNFKLKRNYTFSI